MLHSPQLTCEQHAWHGLCAKAGGMATAGTRQAASTLIEMDVATALDLQPEAAFP